jgi:hypothetical protein
MATRIDPTRAVLELQEELGKLNKQLQATKSSKTANDIRQKILRAEQDLLEARELEVKAGKEAVKLGQDSDRQLNRAKQRTTQAYDQQARQVAKATKQSNRATQQRIKQQEQESREGPSAPSSGLYRTPRGRLRKGALGAAALQGFQQGGAGGAFDAVTDTAFQMGVGAAAQGAGKAKVAGALVAGLALLAQVGKKVVGAANQLRLTMGAQLIELSSPRFREFGSSTFVKAKGGQLDISTALQSKDYEKDYLNEVTALAEAQREAIGTGIKFGLDLQEIEQLKAAVGTIGASTGESFQKGVGKFFGEEGIIQQIARMSSEGMGTIEQITDKYTLAVRQYGMAPEVALKSVRSVAQEARTISLANVLEAGADASSKNVVLMEDFTTAVEEARGEVRSLVATEQGLAKVMGVGLRLANKTTLSYLQKLKAAKDMTRGLTSGFSESFATVTAGRDLDFLIQEQTSKLEALKKAGAPKEEIAAAQEKLERATFLKGQNLLPNELARMMSEAGFDEDLAAVRLKDILTAGKDSLTLKQMMQEGQISYEQLRLFAELEKQIAGGKSIDRVISDYMKEYGPTGPKGIGPKGKGIATAAEEQLRGRQEAIVAQRIGTKDLAMYKQYADQSAEFFAAVSGGTSIFNEVNKAVAETVGIINSLNSSFDTPEQATAKAVAAINRSAAAPTTAVPTSPLPAAFGSSAGGASVDAQGNILVLVPASSLQQAIQIQNIRANGTGVSAP